MTTTMVVISAVMLGIPAGLIGAWGAIRLSLFLLDWRIKSHLTGKWLP